MTFASLTFVVFLVALLPLWALVRRHVTARNTLLLLASYGFYGAWDVRFLGLIALSTGVDYVAARRIHTAPGRARRWLLLSIAVNLGLLITFKYFGFFTASFSSLASGLGWSVDLPTLRIILPVGISFYTFQTLGYTIDVYRRSIEPERNLLTFALFVAWFPQLVAGPIERAAKLLPQLRVVQPLRFPQIQRGFHLVVIGLFKKVVIADNVAYVADRVFAAGDVSRLDVLLATYAFAIQIYCDFSGYTDIARGISKCLGIELSRNFDRPYLAQDPQAFWRRWHITLGTWLRDYVYVPLGGRGGGWRGAGRVLVVFGLAGLWHGAAWTFVVWGLLHGLWLVGWRVFGSPEARTGWRRTVAIVATFHGICAGWLIFRAEDLAQVGTLLSASGTSVLGPTSWRILAACATLGLITALLRTRSGRRDYVFHLPFAMRVAVYLVLWFGIILYGVTDAAPFLYFQF